MDVSVEVTAAPPLSVSGNAQEVSPELQPQPQPGVIHQSGPPVHQSAEVDQAPSGDAALTFERPPHSGSCHCGSVTFNVVGVPEWTAICHCSICRRTHSAPYAELCAYKDENVLILTGEDRLTKYNCNGASKEDRYFCKDCGGKVYSQLNHLGCKAVFLQNLTNPNHGCEGTFTLSIRPNRLPPLRIGRTIDRPCVRVRCGRLGRLLVDLTCDAFWSHQYNLGSQAVYCLPIIIVDPPLHMGVHMQARSTSASKWAATSFTAPARSQTMTSWISSRRCPLPLVETTRSCPMMPMNPVVVSQPVRSRSRRKTRGRFRGAVTAST